MDHPHRLVGKAGGFLSQVVKTLDRVGEGPAQLGEQRVQELGELGGSQGYEDHRIDDAHHQGDDDADQNGLNPTHVPLPPLDPGSDHVGDGSLEEDGCTQGQEGGQEGLGVGGQDTTTIQVPVEGLPQHPCQDREAEDVAQSQGRAYQGRPIAGR